MTAAPVPNFVCEDCGYDVFVIAPMQDNDNGKVCATCRWLRVHIADPEKRDTIRQQLCP